VSDSRKPRVSVGLPVFNGERYLAGTIEAILAQTYHDFELIISDNASTDRTEEICRDFARRDGRVRYHRNETNLGLSRNYTRAFELSSGEYFRWATYDDLVAPTYLEVCVEVLDREPSVVLVHTKSRRIDERGHETGSYDYEMNLDSPLPHVRFHDLVNVRHSCNESMGLARSDVLKRTPLQANYVGSDRVLLAELGLRGRIRVIPEYLFFRRDHAETGSNIPLGQRSGWFDPAKDTRINLPQCREVAEYFKAVRRVRLRGSERRHCYSTLWSYALGRRRKMQAEGEDAAKKLLLRLRPVRRLAAALGRGPYRAVTPQQ
jgi:glycosyltransferase involved in cell wall biosynthesis